MSGDATFITTGGLIFSRAWAAVSAFVASIVLAIAIPYRLKSAANRSEFNLPPKT